MGNINVHFVLRFFVKRELQHIFEECILVRVENITQMVMQKDKKMDIFHEVGG